MRSKTVLFALLSALCNLIFEAHIRGLAALPHPLKFAPTPWLLWPPITSRSPLPSISRSKPVPVRIQQPPWRAWAVTHRQVERACANSGLCHMCLLLARIFLFIEVAYQNSRVCVQETEAMCWYNLWISELDCYSSFFDSCSWIHLF